MSSEVADAPIPLPSYSHHEFPSLSKWESHAFLVLQRARVRLGSARTQFTIMARVPADADTDDVQAMFTAAWRLARSRQNDAVEIVIGRVPISTTPSPQAFIWQVGGTVETSAPSVTVALHIDSGSSAARTKHNDDPIESAESAEPAESVNPQPAALNVPSQSVARLVVTLCGSTRFQEAFERAAYEEGLAGRIVLTVASFKFHETDAPEVIAAKKRHFDALHLDKIDMAHEVLVLNVAGYIGDSTEREIAYALASGTPVRFLEVDRGIVFIDLHRDRLIKAGRKVRT